MLSKCANPACLATFRYLHDGILFHVTVEPAAAVKAGGYAAPTHERFWRGVLAGLGLESHR